MQNRGAKEEDKLHNTESMLGGDAFPEVQVFAMPGAKSLRWSYLGRGKNMLRSHLALLHFF